MNKIIEKLKKAKNFFIVGAIFIAIAVLGSGIHFSWTAIPIAAAGIGIIGYFSVGKEAPKSKKITAALTWGGYAALFTLISVLTA